ncbi:MAG: type II secretion system protein [Phycisphaerae bacterium]
MKTKSGFTLVEILIVVVILGILAAIVIPQFTEASTEAKLSSLCTDLQTLRSQIELYKIQHNDIPPLFGSFVDQMTKKSDINGTVPPAAGLAAYGPYIQKIPINQFNDMYDDTGIHGDLDNNGIVGDDGGSWEYNQNDGSIYPDDSYDGDGDGVKDHINL